MAEKKYDKEIDVWTSNGSTSFVKAKTDWFSGEDKDRLFNSRLHLSFVKHSGKPHCTQQLQIEMGIPMVHAGSDGGHVTGITALGLAAAIRNNQLARDAVKSVQAAEAAGKKYAEDIWSCIGGTPANRSKTGKAEFRKVSIAPASKPGSYVLKAARCEGVESNDIGGISPVKNAQWETIMVPVPAEYMRALGEVIFSEWTAFRTALKTKELVGSLTAATPAPEQTPAPAPAPAPVPAAPANPRNMFVVLGQESPSAQTEFIAVTSDIEEALSKAAAWATHLHEAMGMVQLQPGSFAAMSKHLRLAAQGNDDKFSTVVHFGTPSNDPNKPPHPQAYISAGVTHNAHV